MLVFDDQIISASGFIYVIFYCSWHKIISDFVFAPNVSVTKISSADPIISHF